MMSKKQLLDEHSNAGFFAEEQDSPGNGWAIFRKTLILFAPLLLVVLIVAAVILYSSHNTQRKAVRFSEQHSVDMHEIGISHSIEDIASDLAVFTHSESLQDLWGDQGRPDADKLKSLAANFENVARFRKRYNQVRLLDEKGKEIVRVNYNHGLTQVVPPHKLQDKKGRYYFEDAFRLKPGEVFVSPMDLNVERGQIEQPIKPMIRFASPVFDRQGKKRGVMLLNYFAADLLSSLSMHDHAFQSIPIMLNKEGYWLKGLNPDDEWGFMYQDKKDRVFSRDFPQAWKAILLAEEGQVETPAGLFTFKTLYPLEEGQISSSGSGQASAGSEGSVQNTEYQWKVISYISADVLNETLVYRIQVAVWMSAVMALLLFVGSWRVSRTAFYQQRTEHQLIRFSRALEASQNEIYMFNSETLRFVGVNQGALSNLGYSREQMQALTPVDLKLEYDEESFIKLLEPLSKGMLKKLVFETRHQRKNGTVYPVEVHLELMPETPPIYVAFVKDITDRQKVEEKLRQANMIVESSMAVLFSWKAAPGWPVELVSENVTQFGYTPTQFMSGDISFEAVIYPADIEQVRLEVENYSATGVEHFEQEYRIVSPQGEIFWINDQTNILRDSDGNITHYQGVAIDITERKQLEQEFRKLVQAVEQSPESIVITNLDAEIEYVNESFVQNTGYQPEEVLGQNPRILQSGETPQQTFVDMWTALAQGQAWKGEFYNKRKDGSEFIEFVHMAPIRQPDGTITHYLAIKEDITEKKKLGNELDRYRSHLEEMVNDRTMQLLKEREKAEAANLAKSTFLANMSHEIRTPMNAILGLTYLLQRSELQPDQLERLNKITGSANHLLSILNDILDLSKIEADKLSLEQTDFELGDILENIKSFLDDQARDKGLYIHLDYDPVEVRLNGDPTRLRQALLNYAGNAIKFTDQGGLILRARILEEKDDHILIRLEVEDTGIGIPADKLGHLFESFEQADLSTTRKYGGTGLGLAITRNLALLMGGETGVNSEPGKGSIFWMTARLQRAKATPGKTEEDAMGAELILRTRYAGSRILLVEDNEINLEVALELLKMTDLETDTAENGREAVGKVMKNDYDLILMDVQMPEMDGLEAARVIREIEELAGLPIIAMTANVFEEDKQACFDAGMNDFVAKPVNSQNLFSALIKWLPEKSVGAVSQREEVRIQAEISEHISTVDKQFESILVDENSPVNFETLYNMFGDDRARHIEFLNKFVLQADSILLELEQAVENNDIEQVAFLGHKLKSSARAVGADLLADQMLALELSARKNNVTEVTATLSEIKPAVQALKNYIKNMK